MADSGASAFIFLMTALIVSASVSAVLVDSWKGIADVYADGRDKVALDAKTEISFAGNPMMVNYDTATDTMVFYIQNTGEMYLESNIGGVFVDGVRPQGGGGNPGISTTIVGGGADWGPGGLIEVTLVDTTWTYVDSPVPDELLLSLVANSVISEGGRGTDTLTLTVRLS